LSARNLARSRGVLSALSWRKAAPARSTAWAKSSRAQEGAAADGPAASWASTITAKMTSHRIEPIPLLGLRIRCASYGRIWPAVKCSA